MKIKTLSNTSPEEIFCSFKKAFENYVIPLNLNQESTLQRWEMSNVNFSLSVGAFDNTELVAFILHTAYGKTLFNFATGVVPTHRGRHLIEQISEDFLRSVNTFTTYKLEVIKENLRAVNLYKKLGFLERRELISMKGKLIIGETLQKNYEYHILPLSYSLDQDALRLSMPSTENDRESLLQNPQYHELHELRENGELLAYAIFTPVTLSLREIGAAQVKFLDQLFLRMKMNEEELRLMNLDSSSKKLVQYFEDRGINRFVTQFEMQKSL